MNDKYVGRRDSLRLVRSAAVIAVTLTCMSVIAISATGAADAPTISVTDAQILVYVSPIAEKLRAEGSDMALEQQTSDKLNQSVYYYFWAFNSKRQSIGSVTIGYFAVNKHTAEVWDTNEEELISSTLLLGVQNLIRQANRIDEDTIRKYAASPLWRCD